MSNKLIVAVLTTVLAISSLESIDNERVSVDAFLKNPNVQYFNQLGSFSVIGQSSRATLTPRYYSYPGTLGR